MENVGARRFRQSTRKTDLDRFYYRKVFHGDEAGEYLLLEELGLTVGRMLRRKAVRDRVTRFDE